MGIITKIVNWLKFNLAGLLGILQAGVKFIKEVLTAIVNILFPVVPSEKFKSLIIIIRGVVNKADEYLENIKKWIIPDL